mgnify:FL=1
MTLGSASSETAPINRKRDIEGFSAVNAAPLKPRVVANDVAGRPNGTNAPLEYIRVLYFDAFAPSARLA